MKYIVSLLLLLFYYVKCKKYFGGDAFLAHVLYCTNLCILGVKNALKSSKIKNDPQKRGTWKIRHQKQALALSALGVDSHISWISTFWLRLPMAIAKQGIADRVFTWPMILDGHVTCFLETRSRCSTRMWHISVANRDIRKIPKATNSKSGVADRMVTWPMISRGHVTRFLETRSRCSTRTWRSSVAVRDIWEIPKPTNRKSGVADRMVTWPMISGGHVTCFLETRSRCSTRMWLISVADGGIGKIPKATNSKSGVADRMVTWPMISSGHVTCFLEIGQGAAQ